MNLPTAPAGGFLKKLSPQAFQRFALGVLLYNFGVILWGAFVRASGSGAGCGDHWPLCNGKVIPRAPEIATLIEFGHRLTSGVALLLVVALFLFARKGFAQGSAVRKAATASLVLIIIEALIGAFIVLMRLVGTDASITRGVSISLHLVNTLLLVGALTLTAFLPTLLGAGTNSSGAASWKTLTPLRSLFGVGFLLLLLTGASGAIAALGDTLFPSEPFHIAPQLQLAVEHIFLELRIVHPFVAVGAAVWWCALCFWLGSQNTSPLQSRLTLAVFVSFGVQIGLGLLNVALRAPVWMQLVHLLVADVVASLCVAQSASLWFGIPALAAKEVGTEGKKDSLNPSPLTGVPNP